jgi:predicted PurR-regulated permease PerM
MSFNIQKFAHENRVILIWTAFAFLLYLLRNLFGLVFMTFIMCFIVHGVSQKLAKVMKIKRKAIVIFTYVLFLLAILAFILYGFPEIFRQARTFTAQFPKTVQSLTNYINGVIEDNPLYAPSLEKIRDALTIEVLINKGFQFVITSISQGWHYVTWFFVALIFSFLIILELPELIYKFRALRFTRLHVIYDETVSSVIEFGRVVGENFRAQIIISLINTSLTIAGLSIIGTGFVALLGIIVFCCGLVPVLGVFISSVPIMLVAFNHGGQATLMAVLGLIVIIHALEAYVLNPRIVSSVHRINPVITLMILYIAHSLMGLWGMFLGLPISVYIYRQLIIPKKNNGESAHPALSEPDGGFGEMELADDEVSMDYLENGGTKKIPDSGLSLDKGGKKETEAKD